MDKCSGCGAEILWAKTTHDKPIPLDARSEKRFVLVVGEREVTIARAADTYVSHFATCPMADTFRKPKK